MACSSFPQAGLALGAGGKSRGVALGLTGREVQRNPSPAMSYESTSNREDFNAHEKKATIYLRAL
jgi:hypothetical protein